MWFEVIVSITITMFIRNPCKGKKCLVKACCTEYCDSKKQYLKFCDQEGKIIFQRVCASSVVGGVILLFWSLYKAFNEIVL